MPSCLVGEFRTRWVRRRLCCGQPFILVSDCAFDIAVSGGYYSYREMAERLTSVARLLLAGGKH